MIHRHKGGYLRLIHAALHLPCFVRSGMLLAASYAAGCGWPLGIVIIGTPKDLRDGPPAQSAGFRAPERRNSAGKPESRALGAWSLNPMARPLRAR